MTASSLLSTMNVRDERFFRDLGTRIAQASEASIAQVWDNDEDAAYDRMRCPMANASRFTFGDVVLVPTTQTRSHRHASRRLRPARTEYPRCLAATAATWLDAHADMARLLPNRERMRSLRPSH